MSNPQTPHMVGAKTVLSSPTSGKQQVVSHNKPRLSATRAKMSINSQTKTFNQAESNDNFDSYYQDDEDDDFDGYQLANQRIPLVDDDEYDDDDLQIIDLEDDDDEDDLHITDIPKSVQGGNNSNKNSGVSSRIPRVPLSLNDPSLPRFSSNIDIETIEKNKSLATTLARAESNLLQKFNSNTKESAGSAKEPFTEVIVLDSDDDDEMDDDNGSANDNGGDNNGDDDVQNHKAPSVNNENTEPPVTKSSEEPKISKPNDIPTTASKPEALEKKAELNHTKSNENNHTNKDSTAVLPSHSPTNITATNLPDKTAESGTKPAHSKSPIDQNVLRDFGVQLEDVQVSDFDSDDDSDSQIYTPVEKVVRENSPAHSKDSVDHNNKDLKDSDANNKVQESEKSKLSSILSADSDSEDENKPLESTQPQEPTKPIDVTKEAEQEELEFLDVPSSPSTPRSNQNDDDDDDSMFYTPEKDIVSPKPNSPENPSPNVSHPVSENVKQAQVSSEHNKSESLHHDKNSLTTSAQLKRTTDLKALLESENESDSDTDSDAEENEKLLARKKTASVSKFIDTSLKKADIGLSSATNLNLKSDKASNKQPQKPNIKEAKNKLFVSDDSEDEKSVSNISPSPSVEGHNENKPLLKETARNSLSPEPEREKTQQSKPSTGSGSRLFVSDGNDDSDESEDSDDDFFFGDYISKKIDQQKSKRKMKDETSDDEDSSSSSIDHTATATTSKKKKEEYHAKGRTLRLPSLKTKPLATSTSVGSVNKSSDEPAKLNPTATFNSASTMAVNKLLEEDDLLMELELQKKKKKSKKRKIQYSDDENEDDDILESNLDDQYLKSVSKKRATTESTQSLSTRASKKRRVYILFIVSKIPELQDKNIEVKVFGDQTFETIIQNVLKSMFAFYKKESLCKVYSKDNLALYRDSVRLQYFMSLDSLGIPKPTNDDLTEVRIYLIPKTLEKLNDPTFLSSFLDDEPSKAPEVQVDPETADTLQKKQWEDELQLISDTETPVENKENSTEPESFTISLVGSDNKKISVNVTNATRVQNLVSYYVKQKNIKNYSKITVQFDHEIVPLDSTIEPLDMEEDDMLEILVK